MLRLFQEIDNLPLAKFFFCTWRRAAITYGTLMLANLAMALVPDNSLAGLAWFAAGFICFGLYRTLTMQRQFENAMDEPLEMSEADKAALRQVIYESFQEIKRRVIAEGISPEDLADIGRPRAPPTRH